MGLQRFHKQPTVFFEERIIMLSIDNIAYRICIICVYYGNLPNYFNLWLLSAKANKNIDFYIIGDVSYDSLPLNVKIISRDMEYIKKRTADELNMKVVLDTPY